MLFNRKDPLIIAGMHRSGTTLVAKISQKLGVYLGDFVDPNLEAILFQEYNDWILESANARWDKPQSISKLFDNDRELNDLLAHLKKNVSGTNLVKRFLGKKKTFLERNFLWGWKDPRNSLTLPLWFKLFPQARCLYVYRNGVDVAASLVAREQRFKNDPDIAPRFLSERCKSLEQSFELWEEYHQLFKAQLALCPGIVVEKVCFEKLLHNPQEELENLNKFFSGDPIIENSLLSELISLLDKDKANQFINDDQLQQFFLRKKESRVMKELGY